MCNSCKKNGGVERVITSTPVSLRFPVTSSVRCGRLLFIYSGKKTCQRAGSEFSEKVELTPTRVSVVLVVSIYTLN